MRKPVRTEPSPLVNIHARGRNQAGIDQAGDVSRRRDGKGEEPAVSLVSSSSGVGTPAASAGLDDESNLNDAWLVERARHGDHAAFAVLVRRYERKLIRVLTRLVRDSELARDLAQETFWRVYCRLERFDTARRFGPWLFRVAVNLGLDRLRRGRSEATPPASIDRPHGLGQLPFELPDPDPRIQTELAQEVQYILAQLPVSYRTILVLRDLEGFSSSEVAAIIGRREATVRWRLSKAREKFREVWQRRQEGAQQEVKDG
jgi:RNA polymerase sigma-70 factor (ECF subfamily)